MNYLCIQNPFFTVQKLAGLLELGDLLLIYPKTGMNKYLLSGQQKLFFPSIVYTMHLIMLKQCKAPFYNLTNIFVELQNVIACQFNFECIHFETYSFKDTNGKLPLFEYQLM